MSVPHCEKMKSCTPEIPPPPFPLGYRSMPVHISSWTVTAALHYTEFQAIFSPPEISVTQCASFTPPLGTPDYCTDEVASDRV